MRAPKRRTTLFLLGILLGVTLSAGMQAMAQRYSYSLLRDLSLIAQIIEQVRAYYVEELHSDELIDDAISGIFKDLDSHSSYLDENAISELRNATTGEYVGLGIEVAIQDEQLVVISPIHGSPAEKAGLKAGDVIVAFDQIPVDPDNFDLTLDSMRGDKGQPALLTISRNGTKGALDYRVVRDVIQVSSVEHRLLSNGYGYVRIHTFQHKTSEEMQLALAKLRRHTLRGLVIDVRDNPGGVLSAAVDTANLFLDDGLIVSTKGRFRAANQEFWATNDISVAGHLPILVLINKGSASASEILAGALKDHNRATIAGNISFGKGSVQTLLPIPGFESALKLTTARYYTPNGTSIHGTGITPDIDVGQEFMLDQDLPLLLEQLARSQ